MMKRENICIFDFFAGPGYDINNVPVDQNGVKFLSNKYLLSLEKTEMTDFLYFVSSSYLWRFGSTNEFKNYINFNLEDAKNNPYTFIHRYLINQLKDNLTPSSKLQLYSFTLKKGANIHGIIFGAKHPKALEKFLDIVMENESNKW